MILISHRGNIYNKDKYQENKPDYIDRALETYDAEIDIWYKNKKLYLGHDEPQYNIDEKYILERNEKLWIHCKNIDSIVFLSNFLHEINYFWHEQDTVTLTSKNFIWAFPGKQPIVNSIAVLPEIFNDDISKCIGICSDKVREYNYV